MRRSLRILGYLFLASLLIGLAAGAYWWLRDFQFAFLRPWFLLLLAVLPLLFIQGYRRLTSLGPIRRGMAVGLRGLVILLLILALAEMQTVRQESSLTLLIVVDRSFSIPQEIAEGRVEDERWTRLTKALKDATQRHGQDRVGVISFARHPRLEYPAGPVTTYGLSNLGQIGGQLDRNYTDIASALRMALASFPEGGARRILLITDGNENRGNALSEAHVARLNGVPIDVVPLRFRFDEEILVERIDVPSEVRPDQDIPLRVVIRNFADRRVSGTLTVTRSIDAKVDTARQRTVLEPGLNVLQAKWPARLVVPGGVSNYRAVFLPDNLPGDRADNNEAVMPVLISGQNRNLLVIVQDKNSPTHNPLLQALTRGPKALEALGLKRNIVVREPEELPSDKDQDRFQLTNYDTVIFFNIPADRVSAQQQEALRKNIRDQGVGMVMVGGPDSFGAGRWQGEPLEAALPVDTALRSRKITGKGGLVLIMHASEMMEGNFWQKEIARLAINKLSSLDEVGILYYSYGMGVAGPGHIWHVPLQEIGNERAAILRKLGTMEPGDMPEFDPSMRMAVKSLSEPERGISTRHVILISDGDHGLLQNLAILDDYIKHRITLTTVGVTTHGPAAQEALAAISKACRGRHYPVDDPSELPRIYMKETRVLNQSFLFEKPFRPQLTQELADPLREWNKPFPPLGGLVRTSRKPSNLVQVLMRAPLSDDEENPLLAQWQYGLGRVVAFTSDAMSAGRGWAKDWLNDDLDLYNDFWTRVVEWSMRNLEEEGLALQTRFENGKIRVTLIDQRDKESRAKKPLGSLQTTVVGSTTTESISTVLEPVAPGVYEALVDAEAAGAYSISVTGTTGTVEKRPVVYGRGALAVPYSPEYSVIQDNAGLLAEIAKVTGGRVIEENDLKSSDLFAHDGPAQRSFQPLWYWLLFAAACALFFDVAVRRISIDPVEIKQGLQRTWTSWRHRGSLEAASKQYFERLKSRKAAVGTQLEQKAPPPTAAPPPPRPATKKDWSAEAPPTPAAPKAPPPPQPKPAAEAAADFTARLMQAKKKAREQIDSDDPNAPSAGS